MSDDLATVPKKLVEHKKILQKILISEIDLDYKETIF